LVHLILQLSKRLFLRHSHTLFTKNEKAAIAEGAGISISTLNKYKERLTSPEKQQLHEMVKSNGRPRKYPGEVDDAFVNWARSEQTPLNEKTVDGMISKYLDLMRQLMPGSREDLVNINGVRQHLYRIEKKKGWSMVMPKTIELNRCAIYYRTKKWFENGKVGNAPMGADPDLLFNADETQIHADPSSRRKAALLFQQLLVLQIT